MTGGPRSLDPRFLRGIAHRGLHDASAGVVENTAGAARAAIAAGFGIECDVRPAAGGQPVVFHDETLERLVDGHGAVADIAASDLVRLRHRVGGESLLTFAALLDLVGGRVPLLVEVKSEWEPPQPAFMGQIAALLRVYRGPIAVMSFDPAVLLALRARVPEVPRGLISGSYGFRDGGDWWRHNLSEARRRSLRAMADFDAVGASFAAYQVGDLPTDATKALRARGVPVLTWTIRTADDRARAQAYADGLIFEGFRP